MSTQGLAVFLVLIRAALCVEFIGCPKNLTTYLGCNKTVAAQLDIYPDQSSNCTDDYDASVLLNGEVEHPDIIAIPNSSLCSISLTFPVLELFYDVTFIATHTQSSPQGFDTINCTDLIKVHDSFPSPNMNNIRSSTLCNGILIEWEVLELEDGSLVTQFRVEVEGTNITYTIDNGTSVLIPYDELQFNSEYTVGIYSLHCDRLGNGTSVSIRTAIVPQLANDTSFIQEVKNRSHAVVTFVKNVTNLGCDVSYPSAVDIEILTTSDLNRTFVKYSREVTVPDNGTIAVSLMLPVDKNYTGSFVWKNRYFNSSDESITFDTNQLQSCVFRADRNRIVFSCLYAVGSTLQGCKVTAIDESNQYNYTNISRGDNGEQGVISDMCAGVYSVRCEGKVDTDKDDEVISYSGNQYTTQLELTRASDCHMLSTTTSSTSWTFTSVTSPSESLTGPVQEGKGEILVVLIVVATVVPAMIIILITVVAALLCKKNLRGKEMRVKYSLASEEKGDNHEISSADLHVYESKDNLIDGSGVPKGTETGPIPIESIVIANVPKGNNNEQIPKIPEPTQKKKEETDEEREGGSQVTVSLNQLENAVGGNKLDDENSVQRDLSVEKKVQFQEERHASEDVHPRTGDVQSTGHTRSKSLADEETDRKGEEMERELQDTVSLNKPGNAVGGNKFGGDYQRMKKIKGNSETHSNIERCGSDSQPVPKAKEPKLRWPVHVSSLSLEVLSKSLSSTKKGVEYQYLQTDITASTSETQEDSATPPNDSKPTDSTEFVLPTCRPIVFSQLSSIVSGMNLLGSSREPQASDSETKDLIHSTSEPSDSMEQYGGEIKGAPEMIEQPKTSPHVEMLKKCEDNYEQMIDLEGSTSPLRHVPGRSSHSVSAGETTSTDNNDQVTFGKEIMEKASQQNSANVTNKEKEIGNSEAVSMTKSESQYSVHVSHEEQVPNQEKAYTYIPQYNGNKTKTSPHHEVLEKSEDKSEQMAKLNEMIQTFTSKTYQVNEISFNQEGLFYHLYQYGITIVIPEGAVQEAATLQIGASLMLTGFKCEGSYEPVSPFVWVHTEPVLTKPAELYIPHYAIADSTEDKRKLCLLTRGDGENAEFKANKVIDSKKVKILSAKLFKVSATHFCTICLASKESTKRYHIVYATKKLDNGNTVHVDVCVLYSYHCMKKVTKQYEKEWDIVQSLSAFKSCDVNIKVCLPEHSNWEFIYRDFCKNQISESQIDIYKLLQCTPETFTDENEKYLQFCEEAGLYPPRVKFEFTPTCSPSKKCQAKIFVTSRINNELIEIPIQLKGTLVPPSPVDSGYGKSFQDSQDDSLLAFLEPRLTDWMGFGYYLIGLAVETLHEIEEEIKSNKDFVRTIIHHWREKSPNGSYHDVANALKSLRCCYLSDMLTVNYCSSASDASVCSICQSSECDLLTRAQNDCEALNTEPDLRDLNNLVGAEIPRKWELFGAQLNVNPSILEALEKDYPRDCKLCFQKLFIEWQKTRCSSYTWQTIVEALYSPSVKEYALAEKIYKRFKEVKGNV